VIFVAFVDVRSRSVRLKLWPKVWPEPEPKVGPSRIQARCELGHDSAPAVRARRGFGTEIRNEGQMDEQRAPANGLIQAAFGLLAYSGFELGNDGIKIHLVRIVHQSVFRKIAAIRPQCVQTVRLEDISECRTGSPQPLLPSREPQTRLIPFRFDCPNICGCTVGGPMASRGGLTQSKKINDLSVRGTPQSSHTIIRLSARGCPTDCRLSRRSRTVAANRGAAGIAGRRVVCRSQ
jgi:hypothetical protein